MIRNVLTHITGVEIYGIVSILLFFATFSAAVIYALWQKRSLMQSLAALPLAENEPVGTPENQASHENAR